MWQPGGCFELAIFVDIAPHAPVQMAAATPALSEWPTIRTVQGLTSNPPVVTTEWLGSPTDLPQAQVTSARDPNSALGPGFQFPLLRSVR